MTVVTNKLMIYIVRWLKSQTLLKFLGWGYYVFAVTSELKCPNWKECHIFSQALLKMKRELRSRMEREIGELQKIIIENDKDDHIQDLEVQRLRSRVQMASFQNNTSFLHWPGNRDSGRFEAGFTSDEHYAKDCFCLSKIMVRLSGPWTVHLHLPLHRRGNSRKNKSWWLLMNWTLRQDVAISLFS